MNLEMKVPTVGESITEVTIGQWFKKDGDQVQMDEVICELESDKATFELTAEAAGTLKIKAQEGDTLEIGAVICMIDTESNSESKEEKTAVMETAKSSQGGKTGEIKDMIGEDVYAKRLSKTIEMLTNLEKHGSYSRLVAKRHELIGAMAMDDALYSKSQTERETGVTDTALVMGEVPLFNLLKAHNYGPITQECVVRGLIPDGTPGKISFKDLRNMIKEQV